MEKANEYDVVIIGGGLSGLAACKLLHETGLETVVLEARDRVGGRIYTIKDKAYGYTDAGAGYVGPTQRRVARMAKELGLEFYKVHHSSKSQKAIQYIQGTRRTYSSYIPPVYNPITLFDVNHMELTLAKMSEQVPLNAPWDAPNAKEWDSQTVKQLFDGQLWTDTAKFFGRAIVTALLCHEPEEVSLLHFLWYLRSAGGMQRAISVNRGGQESKILGGAQELPNRVAALLGDRVQLSSPVCEVVQTEDCVIVTTTNGKKYTAKYVISAMPHPLLNRVRFEPPLPSLKSQLTQRMPMGSIFKTMMFYDKAYWREKNLCGETVSDKPPVLYTLDDTKPDGSHPAIMGFMLAKDARDMAHMTPEQRKTLIANHYADIFRCEEMKKPVNYVELNWMAEEYSGGCYTSVMPPGVLTEFGRVMRDPHGRIYWATTETASEWAGYMDGAIQAGERAAREVLFSMGKITEIEIDQDEPACDLYPESPPLGQGSSALVPSVSQLLWIAGAVVTGLAAWALQAYGFIKVNLGQ